MRTNYIININGVIGNEENSSISVLDKGFLYGDSVYDVTYAKEGHPIFLDEHIDRLWNSASLLDMHIAFNKNFLKAEVERTLKEVSFSLSYIRFIITRGQGDIDISSTPDKQNFVIIVKELAPYPQHMYQEGISLYLGERLRNDRKATDPNAKSGNYLNSVLAIREAKNKGFTDAIFKNSEGFIAEGTTFNLWLIKDGIIRTPHEDCGLLEGITRAKILSLGSEQLTVEKAFIKPEDLLDSDAVFISSTTKGIMPVAKINETKFDVNNDTLKTITKAYQKLT